MSKLILSGISGFIDPTDITNLIVWFDGDYVGNTVDTTTYDSFSIIADRSGNGNHATQGTKLNQPTRQTVGSKYFWQTDGTADYLELTDETAFQNDSECTIFQVLNNTTIRNYPIDINYRTALATFLQPFCAAHDVGLNYSWLYIVRDNLGTVWNQMYGNIDMRNNKFVTAWRTNGTAYSMRVNGVPDTFNFSYGSNDGDFFDDFTNQPDYANLGRSQINGGSNTYYRTSFVGDWLYYNRSLTDTEVANVENYLIAKHSIT